VELNRRFHSDLPQLSDKMQQVRSIQESCAKKTKELVMNPICRKHNVTALLVLAGISSCSTALTQEIPTETLRPGKTVTYTIAGEGDVDKVTGVEILFDSKRSAPPPDQQGYQTSFDNGRLTPKPGGRESLEVTVTIPDSVASGEYSMTTIIVYTANGATYGFGVPKDFTAPPSLRIENPGRFKVSIKTVNEKH
jgi:hypothetical protein